MTSRRLSVSTQRTPKRSQHSRSRRVSEASVPHRQTTADRKPTSMIPLLRVPYVDARLWPLFLSFSVRFCISLSPLPALSRSLSLALSLALLLSLSLSHSHSLLMFPACYASIKLYLSGTYVLPQKVLLVRMRGEWNLMTWAFDAPFFLSTIAVCTAAAAMAYNSVSSCGQMRRKKGSRESERERDERT